MKNYWNIFFLTVVMITFIPCIIYSQISTKKIDGQWKLLIDDKPFEVKGVTFGYNDVENYDTYFSELNKMGVNTIRTWSTDIHTQDLLNSAQKYNIKVMLGIWMRHGKPGMEADDSFDYINDTEGKMEMYKDAKQTVDLYKDHPALLAWGIGNEVYLNTETDEEKLAYSIFLEEVCSMVKSIDSIHPIISVEAWIFGLEWWSKYVPSIDIFGLNAYGNGAAFLQKELQKRGIEFPYIVTEYGVTGEWDITTIENGAKVEPTDIEKYNAIATDCPKWMSESRNCLGLFVFHYADGDSHIAPWLFTHFKSLKRPQYWGIRKLYTGLEPQMQIGKISQLTLNADTLHSSSPIEVTPRLLSSIDQEEKVTFYYNQRSGSRKRRDQLIPVASIKGGDAYVLSTPKEHGPVKLYMTLQDTIGNIHIATKSIYIIDEEESQRKYKVPKAKLPYSIYADGNLSGYTPSAYMGNYKSMKVDIKHHLNTDDTVIKIDYDQRDGWYGIGFVDPANDWGEILGGYDFSGAQTFSFRAKANDKVNAEIGFGLISDDKPFPDTAIKMKKLTLGKKWKKYTIKVKKEGLSCIRSGFVLFSSADGFPQTIYIDDIVFE